MKTHKIIESPKKEANEEHYGIHHNSCVCCGKLTAEKLFIHANTNWMAINTENEDLSEFDMESQGLFPIGPECAKKYPKEFIFGIK